MWADSHSEKLSTAVSTQTVIRAHTRFQHRTDVFVALIVRGRFIPPRETGHIIDLSKHRTARKDVNRIMGKLHEAECAAFCSQLHHPVTNI